MPPSWILAARYAAWALWSEEGRQRHGHGVLFQIPAKTDPARLVPVETVESGSGLTVMRLPESHQRPRQGFGLTDCGTDLIGALDEANYCIECHNQGKDSCSKGLTRPQERRVPEKPVRRDAGGLSAGREDFGSRTRSRRRAIRSARWR